MRNRPSLPVLFTGIFFLLPFFSCFSRPVSALNLSLPTAASATACLDQITDLLSPKRARQAFQNLADKGKSAIPTIRTMLTGKNLRLVRAALDLAGKIDDPGRDLQKQLLQIVSTRRLGNLRLRAMRVLGSYGQTACQSLPTLSRLLLEPSAELRVAAAEAFLDVLTKGPRQLPQFMKQLRDPSHPVRKAALQLLQTAAPLAHPAAPLLIDYLETGSFRPSRAIGLLLPSHSLLRSFAEPLLAGELASGPDPDAEAIQEEPDLANSMAIESEMAEADAADSALSFEDVPAHEP